MLPRDCFACCVIHRIWRTGPPRLRKHSRAVVGWYFVRKLVVFARNNGICPCAFHVCPLVCVCVSLVLISCMQIIKICLYMYF